jgi:hypothetical protein
MRLATTRVERWHPRKRVADVVDQVIVKVQRTRIVDEPQQFPLAIYLAVEQQKIVFQPDAFCVGKLHNRSSYCSDLLCRGS